MTSRIEISDQVKDFVRGLAPEPRRVVKTALRKLTNGDGDIKALEAELTGFWRLRVGRYRVIFHYHIEGRRQIIRCDHAGRRSLIYEVFAEELIERIRKRWPPASAL